MSTQDTLIRNHASLTIVCLQSGCMEQEVENGAREGEGGGGRGVAKQVEIGCSIKPPNALRRDCGILGLANAT